METLLFSYNILDVFSWTTAKYQELGGGWGEERRTHMFVSLVKPHNSAMKQVIMFIISDTDTKAQSN